MIKKSHKKYPKTLAHTRHLLKFGDFGFKITTSVSLTKEQLFSFERAIQKKVRSLISNSKEYKFWCFLTPNNTDTKLTSESRMGKGKGAVYTESIFVRSGCIIYEVQNLKLHNILELFLFLKKLIPANLILVKNK